MFCDYAWEPVCPESLSRLSVNTPRTSTTPESTFTLSRFTTRSLYLTDSDRCAKTDLDKARISTESSSHGRGSFYTRQSFFPQFSLVGSESNSLPTPVATDVTVFRDSAVSKRRAAKTAPSTSMSPLDDSTRINHAAARLKPPRLY
ncbi:PREDICTED: uncharacterized protein LOC105570871 [Vollenhovia emeryi]|uniref:uncharacterized protein LOC105570871 n=1 Tax=Vollenhovia emeryi TaxID=411798 RepID=UPI0005F52333|nr:PREDICTED: uncharacterized protein LOC105570871 [Vollenhovia emeryi]